MAAYLAERGARLVLGARREDQLHAVVDQITEQGGSAAATVIAIGYAIERPARIDISEIVVRPTMQA
ncbi:hypothetical protein [Streptomyces sp. NPDC094472]|uniref:hypothetical protein n=1 Tax=unclassified Streptomyces TaxID=2593676 RepID=UPI0033308456